MEKLQRVNLAMTKIWSSLSPKSDCMEFNNETFVLKISAKDLALFEDENVGKTDSSHYVFVDALLSDESGNFKEIGSTEMLEDNPHLNWDHTFLVKFSANGNQKIKLRIWTHHRATDTEELFGQATFDLSSLVAQHNNYISKQVTTTENLSHAGELRLYGEQNLPHAGELRLYGDHLVPENQVVTIEFSAHILNSVILIHEPDLYFVISKMSCNGTSATEVYRSEVIWNNLNPKWKQFRIGLQQLCDGDLNRNLKLECFQCGEDGDNFIGSVVTNVKQMLNCYPTQNKEFYFDVSKICTFFPFFISFYLTICILVLRFNI